MTWVSDLPVQRKLGYAMLFTSTVALVLACGVFLAIEYRGYLRNLQDTVATLARLTADNSTATVAFGDNRGARQNLEALRAEPQIIAATLFDADGNVFARYNARPHELVQGSPADPPGVRVVAGYVVAVQPVVEGTRRLGTLHLQATMEQIYARMRTYSLVVLGVLGVSFALAGLLAGVLRRTLARPILELADIASTVSANQNYALRARRYGRDELGQLTATFNVMLEKTQAAVEGLRESEWAHRELVRALPTAAYMCDARGLLTIFNEAAVALWGRTPVVGREHWCGSHRLFQADGTPRALDQCPTAVSLREGRSVPGEELIIERPDGSRRNVLSHAEPIRDTAGQVVGIVNMLVDITEQKRANLAVRQLAAIVESSDDAILSKDLDGVITSWNRGAEQLFGYTAGQMIGQPVALIISAEHPNEEPDILRRIRRGERIEHYETKRRRLDGSLVDVALTVSPIKDAEGRIIGASTIARDITERKATEHRAEFLSQLSQQLSSISDPDAIVRSACRAVGVHLGTDRCFFCTHSEEEATMAVSGDWGRDGFASATGLHRTADFGTPELWRAMARGPIAIDDIAEHDLTRKQGPGYATLRIGAHAAVPFLREGKWIASLLVSTERPRAWQKGEAAVLENAIARVWPMVERARTQRELQESVRRLRELMRALPVACYTLDVQGRLTFFNDAAVQLWGRTPELGSTLWCGSVAMASLDGRPIEVENYPAAVALREKHPVRGVEAFVVRPDGTRRWVVPHPDPILDATGNCIGVVNVVMDVTEERTAHEKTQKVAERLSLAIASVNLGDWTWDADTDLISLSPRTAEIFGIPAAEGLTRSALRLLLHEDDRERSRLALQRAMETHTDYDVDYRVNRPDGNQRWVAAKGRSFYGKDGLILGMVGVVQDITERKSQAEEMEKLSRQIKTQAQLFDATLSNITDLAYYFDLKGRWIYANKPLLEIWGRSLEQITGKSCLELGYPPALAARLEAQIQEVIETKRAVRGETLYTGADGKEDLHEYIFNPVMDAQGTVTAVVGTTRLITERKRAEETLRQSEAQLRLVTDNAPIFLVRTDRQHCFTFVNRAYAERNGFQPQEMIGMKVSEVVGASAFAEFRPRMEAALAGERVEFEVEAHYEKLGSRWIQAILVPETAAGGRITGLLGVITDIGARKQAEIELKRARDEAVAASRAKDGFLAALSHELRTPLNPVLLLASDGANNPKLAAEIRADFELILKNVQLEARLIDDLLDLTRITQGKLHLERTRCNAHTVLLDALANVKADIVEKKLRLELDLGAKQCRVLGDSVRLQQIFWNVLKNAVKFTPEGGKISVATSLTAGGATLTLRIADSGIGMTEVEIGRVFQAFSQGDHASGDAAIHRFGGLGLGLAITQNLVELHGGKIQAFSDGRDRGSVFQVDLPLCREGAEDGKPSSRNSPSVHSTPPSPGMVAQLPALRRRILLVDDHAATRLTLQHLLRQRHFDVTTAESAAVAERLVQTQEFDLVVSDVGLPDRSGYELMASLRSTKPDLPGIALSGYGMEDDLARSRAAGFFLHLIKPVTIGMLEEAIASLPRRLTGGQDSTPVSQP